MNHEVTIVIPTLKRLELLALTLEHLSQIRQASQIDFRIFVDHTTEERLAEVDYVRDTYLPSALIFHARNHPLVPSGSYNILMSLRAGFLTGSAYVGLVEEDVFVTPDFVDRHLELQASGDYFVTSGRKLPNRDDTYYTNPGSFYRHEKLGLVIPHINDQYFADQKNYVETHFPALDDCGTLDDGLIRRVMVSSGGKAKCLVPSAAFHQGLHYFGRMPQFTVEGTLQERVEKLRVLLPTINPKDRYSSDFEPYLP